MTPRRLSHTAAAAYLGVSENHLNEHVARVVPPLRFGRRAFWDIKALDRWLDERSGLVLVACAAPENGKVIPLRLVTGVKGMPYTEDGFRTMWDRFKKRLVRQGKLRPGLKLTFHGLRHSVGTYLAEAGATQEMIMAILNHKTLAMSALYTSRANKKRLASAAVALLYPEKNEGK